MYKRQGNSTQDKVDRLGLLGVSDILDIVDQTGIAQLKNVLMGRGCACMLGACRAMRNKVIMALAKGDGHKAMELDRKKTILCNYAAECAPLPTGWANSRAYVPWQRPADMPV